jgi:two-component system, OmpR family, sensor kinase
VAQEPPSAFLHRLAPEMTTTETKAKETTTTETTETEPMQPIPSSGPTAAPLAGIRTRLLAWFVILLALGTATSVLVVRQILLHRLNERIGRELVQEVRELRFLARGNDPETGEAFRGRVGRIFEVFLERNIPARNEAIVTFVDGEPFLRSRPVVPYRLDQDPELQRRWSTLEQSDRGTIDTPAGAVEFLAVPVLSSGGDTRGVFVVAHFRDREQAEVHFAAAGVAGAGLVLLLIGSLLAWRLAERILVPVREVSTTARSITETDLARRIDVKGRDEIAHLARTFNEMLDRLERAFAAQKQFVDDAGHELRTPITVIRGHLETIEEDPEERAQTMALILDELGRMSRLVEDLMLLARSERPDFLHLTTVDVASLTEEVFQKARALADRRWTLDGVGRGLVVADRHRMTQALLQLAQNASEHTSPDDTIAIGSKISNGDASFWVRDSGHGIPDSERAAIFERSVRGSTRTGRGVGLGLAIVKAIVKAHSGRVSLQSAQGVGARFEVTIPVDQPEELQGAST